jgi:cytochrome c553
MRINGGVWVLASAACLGFPLMLCAAYFANSAEPPVRVPSNVAWTEDTIAEASGGDALRGLLISRRCEHCHGEEGFSAEAPVPNLAAMDRLAFWKQVEDFRSGKRVSPIMQTIAGVLTEQDSADLAAYYSMLPDSADPQDNRSFPQRLSAPQNVSIAARLVTLGDGERGVPPCQACHGPVAHVRGAPSLTTQNGDYIFAQLEAFAHADRSNDINMPMRTIAGDLTEAERRAISQYYGAGLGALPAARLSSQGHDRPDTGDVVTGASDDVKVGAGKTAKGSFLQVRR